MTRQTKQQQLPWVSLNLDQPLLLATAPPAVALADDATETGAPPEAPVRRNPELLSQSAKVEQMIFETAQQLRMPAMRDLALEDSLKSFERGVELTRICQKALADAEQKVRILTEKSVDAELQPFSSDDR